MSANGHKLFVNGEWIGTEDTFADYNPASWIRFTDR